MHILSWFRGTTNGYANGRLNGDHVHDLRVERIVYTGARLMPGRGPVSGYNDELAFGVSTVIKTCARCGHEEHTKILGNAISHRLDPEVWRAEAPADQ